MLIPTSLEGHHYLDLPFFLTFLDLSFLSFLFFFCFSFFLSFLDPFCFFFFFDFPSSSLLAEEVDAELESDDSDDELAFFFEAFFACFSASFFAFFDAFSRRLSSTFDSTPPDIISSAICSSCIDGLKDILNISSMCARAPLTSSDSRRFS